MAQVQPAMRYRPLPEFPEVVRDLALIADESVTCGAITAAIRKACKNVSDIELFDVYRGEQVGAGKKSMAFKVHFAPADKPLTPEEVNRFVKKILGNLNYQLHVEIR